MRMFSILGVSLLMFGCLPVWYDSSGISDYLATYDEEHDKPYECSWHRNNIGLHFGKCGVKPRTLFKLDLGIVRTHIYWPPFHSTSIGLLGYRGFQFYYGIKYDPTSDDYLFSGGLRLHKLSEPGIKNQAGS